MVEGPGCKVKGQKLRARIRGQTLKKVGGKVVEKLQAKSADGQSTWFDKFKGRAVDDIQTLGKELFMFFGDLVLRFHFLMNGSYRLNDQNEAGDKTDKKGQRPECVLFMENDSVAFYETSVLERISVDCYLKLEELRDLDICHEVYNQRRAVALVTEQCGRLVCDVLLDQLILPGVGNIIKNEALFDSGIRPDTKIEKLTQPHISHLVKMTRDFSMVFYKCRKENKSLRPYMKIYEKDTCRQCGSRVTVCRLGEDSARLTFFCAVCQANDLTKAKQRKLPSKNSLLGWVSKTTDDPIDQQNWACSVCTLINKYSRTSCSACLTPRSCDTPQSQLKSCDQTHPERCPASADEKSTKSPKYSFKSLSNVKGSPGNCHNKTFTSELKEQVPLRTVNITHPKSSKHNTDLTSISTKMPNSHQNKGSVQKQASRIHVDSQHTAVSPDHRSKVPICDKHKKPCVMREVRKQGPNQKRMFFSCSLATGKNCQFFQWADEDFPICEGHGKKAVIRTVMKLGSNNGRKFFACSAPKNKQCQFFQWAEGY